MTNAFLPGLCSVTFRQLPPAGIIALAADAKLAAIEWGGDVHVPPGDPETAVRVGRATRDAGLAVSSYGSYLAPPDASSATIDAVLDATEALGAPHLRIWAGSRDRPSSDYSVEDRQRAVEAIREIAARAAARRLTVGLEYHPQSLTDALASARGIMTDLADMPNLFLYWQPAPGLPLADALTETAAIGREVCHLHVFAWDTERRRLPLAAQADYWTRGVAALPERRWTGTSYAMLEFVANDDPAAFREDAATLRIILSDGRSRS